MPEPLEEYDVAFIGCGPSCVGFLLFLLRNREETGAVLPFERICVIERSASAGAGDFGFYSIRTNSSLKAFISIVPKEVYATFSVGLKQLLVSIGGDPCPLGCAALLFEEVVAFFKNHTRITFYSQYEVKQVEEANAVRATGLKGLVVRAAPTAPSEKHGLEFAAHAVVSCVGATQTRETIVSSDSSGTLGRSGVRQKLVPSGVCLRMDDEMTTRSGGTVWKKEAENAYDENPDWDTRREKPDWNGKTVALIGNSHSTWSVIASIVGSGQAFKRIDVHARHQTKVFFEDVAAAQAASYPFTQEDVCPSTNQVHRFGGLRCDAKLQWISWRHGLHPDIKLVISDAPLSEDALRGYDHIVCCFGHRRRTFPGSELCFPYGLMSGLTLDEGEPSFTAPKEGVVHYSGAYAQILWGQIKEVVGVAKAPLH